MLNFKKKGKKNICFVGLMGSGKSVVGRALSVKNNIKFYDSDLEIEKEVGLEISTIFSDKGEKFFRKIEEEICSKLLEINNCVISLGGGSIKSKKIRDLIKKNSFSVYLKVDIDNLVNRLTKSKKRPLLQNVNKKDKLNSLLTEREEFYNNADLIIENNYDKKNIIVEIEKKIKII